MILSLCYNVKTSRYCLDKVKAAPEVGGAVGGLDCSVSFVDADRMDVVEAINEFFDYELLSVAAVESEDV